MKYFSTFSGIGGFEKAIQQAYETIRDNKLDCRKDSISNEREENIPNDNTPSRNEEPICVGYSEIDRYAIQIYEKHFNHKNYGDITKINAEELPDFDLLVGGFPCQAFSIAGKRKGFEDTRGTLFFDLARILRAKQPKLFVFENVKGLLSHDNGNTFKTIISTLDELGYDLQWQVLNSKNHGVPQNRERVFIIGNLRGTSRPEVFPFGQGDGIPDAGDEGGVQTENSGTLGASQYKRQHTGTYIKQLNNPTHSNNRIYGTDGLSPTINTAQGENRQPKIVAHYGHKDKPATEHDISPTLKAQSHGHEPMATDGMKIRRLTPTECERLQGFPDGWTEGVSDTQRYKTLGNAVTVNTVQDVMEKILPLMGK